jgi:hypothetical protein
MPCSLPMLRATHALCCQRTCCRCRELAANANRAKFLSSHARRADRVTAVIQRVTVCQQLTQKRPEKKGRHMNELREILSRVPATVSLRWRSTPCEGWGAGKTVRRIASDCATRARQRLDAPPAVRDSIDADALPHGPPCCRAFLPRFLGSTS